MAIRWDSGETQYEGCVIETRERNYHDDSDFYAVVWDEENQALKEITYASTRFGGGGNVTVDITPENMKKVEEWCRARTFAAYKDAYEYQARQPEMEKIVRVVRGRKVPHGTQGKIFWTKEQTFSPRFRNGYKHGPDTIKIGIALDETKDARNRYVNVAWTYMSNVEVVDPQKYVPSDEEIMKKIQNPYQQYRSYLGSLRFGVSYIR